MHKVTVKEVLQTSNYTYLLVKENNSENWLALPKMQASEGQTFYYRNGFRMTDFESKELGRKFASVFFLESISTTPDIIVRDSTANPHKTFNLTDSTSKQSYKSSIKVKNENIKLEPAEGGITIAELFGNKDAYSGKTVRVKGKVTKFNASIMKRNWIHIQDGTEYEGKFDLTITTDQVVNIGDVITLEGKVALNKDFGYGYSYEVLLEDARTVSK